MHVSLSPDLRQHDCLASMSVKSVWILPCISLSAGWWEPRETFTGRKSFARYKCQCDNMWMSAHGFPNVKQGVRVVSLPCWYVRVHFRAHTLWSTCHASPRNLISVRTFSGCLACATHSTLPCCLWHNDWQNTASDSGTNLCAPDIQVCLALCTPYEFSCVPSQWWSIFEI